MSHRPLAQRVATIVYHHSTGDQLPAVTEQTIAISDPQRGHGIEPASDLLGQRVVDPGHHCGHLADLLSSGVRSVSELFQRDLTTRGGDDRWPPPVHS